MEVIAQNQPGLLHNVALVLEKYNITLLSARIATFGERAEDVFYIQQHDHTPVTDENLLNSLSKEICSSLNRNKSDPKGKTHH